MSTNLSELLGRKDVNENLFDKLGKLAHQEGTPSEEAMKELADEFLIGKANAFGTASFYDFLKPENKGNKFTYATVRLVFALELKKKLLPHFRTALIPTILGT